MCPRSSQFPSLASGLRSFQIKRNCKNLPRLERGLIRSHPLMLLGRIGSLCAFPGCFLCWQRQLLSPGASNKHVLKSVLVLGQGCFPSFLSPTLQVSREANEIQDSSAQVGLLHCPSSCPSSVTPRLSPGDTSCSNEQ